jgi:hypothetical protein
MRSDWTFEQIGIATDAWIHDCGHIEQLTPGTEDAPPQFCGGCGAGSVLDEYYDLDEEEDEDEEDAERRADEWGDQDDPPAWDCYDALEETRRPLSGWR